MNELSISLQQALQDNRLTGIKLGPNCPPIHSLLYVDDLIICGKAAPSEAMHIKNILQNFCNDSGQTPNWAKSSILLAGMLIRTLSR